MLPFSQIPFFFNERQRHTQYLEPDIICQPAESSKKGQLDLECTKANILVDDLVHKGNLSTVVHRHTHLLGEKDVTVNGLVVRFHLLIMPS